MYSVMLVFIFSIMPRPPPTTLFPYTTLFRSLLRAEKARRVARVGGFRGEVERLHPGAQRLQGLLAVLGRRVGGEELGRSAAELAHLVPQRHRGGRIVAGARRELDADLVGLGFALAAVAQLDRG